MGGAREPLAKIGDRVATPRRSPACTRRLSGTGGSIPGSADGAGEGRRTETARGSRKSAAGAVAEEPCQAAPHLALAEFLLENLRYAEAETVAVAALQRCPASAELRLVLARIQHQLLRREDAKKTIEALIAIAPENAWAWFEYGKILWNSFEPADGAFERAADVARACDVALAESCQQRQAAHADRRFRGSLASLLALARRQQGIGP